MVEEFEKAFAAFCTTSHCAAISSGTDALRFALMAAGVQPGMPSAPSRTPSSPRLKPFHSRGRCRNSSTSMSALTTWIREATDLSGNPVHERFFGQV